LMQIDELAGALYRWADAAWEFVQGLDKSGACAPA